MDSDLNEATMPADDLLSETPEDVAILYSWANLHGAKYRDFSASRREYRAQVRHRAAEELREQELQAKAEAEAAAAAAERVAREAERAAANDNYDSGISRERALRDAEDAARRAAAERVEAARRAESAALAEAVARREEREIAEAHASAQRQAARYEEHESRRRTAAGPQPRPAGLQSDPYEFSQGSSVDDLYSPNRALDYTQPTARYRDEYGARASGERQAFLSGERRAGSGERSAFASGERRVYSGERRIYKPVDADQRRRPQGYKPDEASGIRPLFRPASEMTMPRSRAADDYGRGGMLNLPERPERVFMQDPQPPRPQVPARADLYTSEVTRPYEQTAQQERQDRRLRQDRLDRQERQERSERSDRPERKDAPNAPYQDQSGPAWLYSGTHSPLPTTPASVANTLQDSRERVASRWFALKGVFDPADQPIEDPTPVRRQESRTPVLAVFSLAGGVGKTSMVATLGRALSSIGEKVLLADTTSHGLLPYYFGASELKPGVVRTFSPPSGSTDAPIYMVSYDVSGDRASQETFSQELTASASGTHRIVLDLNSTSGWTMRRLTGMIPTVLVPVAPDMNSVISLQSVEKYFAGITDSDGRVIQPYYVLNQFDAALPLHLDVREVLRRQLGDRLLQVAIRRAPAVSEALAEGMTVVDYAPDSGVAEDYLNLANWLRSTSAPASQGFRNVRWSER